MNTLNTFIEEIKICIIKTKTDLKNHVEKFNLVIDGAVYYCDSFAVRFSYSGSGGFSNTILSLSKLQKHDRKPFLVCLVKLNECQFFLANSTFLSKISHSSQALRIDNIKGSFNGSDIMKKIGDKDIENNEKNFADLFAIHAEIDFHENLARLVEATNSISPTGKKIEISDSDKEKIYGSIVRARDFCKSNEFTELKRDLDDKVEKNKEVILAASHIENVNIRGRVIEYIVAGDDNNLKDRLAKSLLEGYSELPSFKTENRLGDFQKEFDNYCTETDIKTKILFLNSNPKAYNIDKFLEFHCKCNTVFLEMV